MVVLCLAGLIGKGGEDFGAEIVEDVAAVVRGDVGVYRRRRRDSSYTFQPLSTSLVGSSADPSPCLGGGGEDTGAEIVEDVAGAVGGDVGVV